MFSFDQRTEYAFDPDVMKVFKAAIINSFRVRVNDVSNDHDSPAHSSYGVILALNMHYTAEQEQEQDIFPRSR